MKQGLVLNNLRELQEFIGYKFNDVSILEQALTHSSFANDNNKESYERLEFLGDAVIELVVSEYIYKYYYFNSGELSKLRASLVSTEYLNNVALKLHLHELVKKSKGLQYLSKKNTADLFESLVGAIYVDGGLKEAENIIYKFVIIDITNVDYVLNNNIDFKTQLQELLQAEGKSFEYMTVASSGLDHEKIFEVNLIIDGESVVSARATSIHLAENNCAEKYIKQIKLLLNKKT